MNIPILYFISKFQPYNVTNLQHYRVSKDTQITTTATTAGTSGAHTDNETLTPVAVLPLLVLVLAHLLLHHQNALAECDATPSRNSTKTRVGVSV